jgi:thymidylate synthase
MLDNYNEILVELLKKGKERSDRTGTGTLSLFGRQYHYNIQDCIPLVTTKKVSFKLVLSELLWFIKGSTNVKDLHQYNNHIWDEWADHLGDVGKIYGYQWNNWGNQLNNVIHEIKTNPYSRRLVISAWNVSELDQMNLLPCHVLFQFYVHDNMLSCHLYQRSADAFLGLPFNIASYSILTYMVAQVTNLKPFEFIHSIGDLHLYKNHIEQALLQTTRQPYEYPQLIINPHVSNIHDFTMNDFKLVNYQHHPTIKADISV